MRKAFITSSICLLFFALVSCGGQQAETNTTSFTPKELTSMAGVTEYWECPMKCEDKKYSESGICPICGMGLVKVEVKKEADTLKVEADTTQKI
jgi:hypothetical protein